MPNWLVPVITLVIGSGGIGAFINHKLQQSRERKRERREARAAWVARQREVCTSLLEAVISGKSWLFTVRSLHDDLSSRVGARKQLELALQQFPSFREAVHSVRRELDLEPNAQLQGVIDRWSDAFRAYHDALMRPMLSWWNPLRFYFGKAPQDKVNRLAQDFDARTRDLQDAVRAYRASLESPGTTAPTPRFSWAFKLKAPRRFR